MRPPLLEVELDVFSGRPNPSWQLTAKERDDLWRLVDALDVASGPAVLKLGYRGFVVRSANGDWRAAWLRVAAGVVEVRGSGGSYTYRDTAGIEDWFREMAVSRGFGALVPGGRP